MEGQLNYEEKDVGRFRITRNRGRGERLRRKREGTLSEDGQERSGGGERE